MIVRTLVFAISFLTIQALAHLESAETLEVRDEPAVLTLNNHPIIIFRASLFGFSPKKRSLGAEKQIEALIEESPDGPVTAHPSDDGTVINIAGHRAFVINPKDLDSSAGQSMQDCVQETIKRIENILRIEKLQHDPLFILKKCLWLLLATLAFAGAISVILRIRRWGRDKIDSLFQRLRIKDSRLLSWVINSISTISVLVLTYIWLSYCLKLFPYTEVWGETLGGLFFSAALNFLKAIVRYLPDLGVIILIAIATRFAASLVKSLFESPHRLGLEPQAAQATCRIASIIIWLFALVMAYPYLPGSNSEAFKGVSVFVGLLISLGATSVVGQFTSGLVLMYSKALKPGEYVRVGEHEGTVLTVGFLSTKILTPKNEEVHLPNLVLLGTSLMNYSRLARERGLILYTSVTIGYNTPWRQVQELLIEAANRTPGLQKMPQPFVLQRSLSDFYVQYELNVVMIDPTTRLLTLSLLHSQIQDLFNEYGVQIMSPHYLQDPPSKVWVPKDRWFEPPANSPAKNGE